MQFFLVQFFFSFPNETEKVHSRLNSKYWFSDKMFMSGTILKVVNEAKTFGSFKKRLDKYMSEEGWV